MDAHKYPEREGEGFEREEERERDGVRKGEEEEESDFFRRFGEVWSANSLLRLGLVIRKERERRKEKNRKKSRKKENEKLNLVHKQKYSINSNNVLVNSSPFSRFRCNLRSLSFSLVLSARLF